MEQRLRQKGPQSEVSAYTYELADKAMTLSANEPIAAHKHTMNAYDATRVSARPNVVEKDSGDMTNAR